MKWADVDEYVVWARSIAHRSEKVSLSEGMFSRERSAIARVVIRDETRDRRDAKTTSRGMVSSWDHSTIAIVFETRSPHANVSRREVRKKRKYAERSWPKTCSKFYYVGRVLQSYYILFSVIDLTALLVLFCSKSFSTVSFQIFLV